MSIPKADMVEFVRSLDLDPWEVKRLTIDRYSTTYEPVVRITDEAKILDWLFVHHIDDTDVVMVEFTNDAVTIVRTDRDEHGSPKFKLSEKSGIELQYRTEVLDIE